MLLDEEDEEVEGAEDDELLDEGSRSSWSLTSWPGGATLAFLTRSVPQRPGPPGLGQFTPMLQPGAAMVKFLRLTVRTPSTR